MHLNSELVFERHAKPCFRAGQRVLEIAPDKVPSTLRKLVGIDDLTWDVTDIGSTIDAKGTRLYGGGGSRDMTFVMSDPYVVPAPDDSFDIIVAANVVEHVARTWVWIKELARICKPGGHVILVAPISWPEHKAPLDCWRIYPDGMRALSDEAGLALELCRVETLEPSISRRTFPGSGSFRNARPRTMAESVSQMVFQAINWPRPVAHDIVAVMAKPRR